MEHLFGKKVRFDKAAMTKRIEKWKVDEALAVISRGVSREFWICYKLWRGGKWKPEIELSDFSPHFTKRQQAIKRSGGNPSKPAT